MPSKASVIGMFLWGVRIPGLVERDSYGPVGKCGQAHPKRSITLSNLSDDKPWLSSKTYIQDQGLALEHMM